MNWMSIGCGTIHELAREFANQDMDRAWPHLQGEVGWRGGAAFSIATSVGLSLARAPQPSISSQLQIGTVWPDRYEIKTVDGQLAGPAWSMWRQVESTGLAKSWGEFARIAADAGLSAAASAC
jgi:hypothetical protein